MFHVYQHVTSLSRMRIAMVGKTRLPANTNEQRPVVTLWSLYANSLEVSLRDRYERKLEQIARSILYAIRLAKQPQSVAGSNVRRHLPLPYQHARNVQSTLMKAYNLD